MKKIFVLLPVLAGVLWGSVGVFVRVLKAAGMDNMTVLSVRMTFAAVLLFAGLMLYDRQRLKIKAKEIWLFLCTGILGMVGLNYCYNEAINRLTLSLSAVLLSLSPIFVMVFAAFLFKEKITVRKVVCVLFAIIGCVLVSGILESGSGLSWSRAGILVGVLSAVFYALYGIFSRLAMEREYDVFTITFYSILIAAVFAVPFTDWNVVAEYIAQTPAKSILFLIVHALCTSVLPYVLFTLGVSYTEAGKASILAAGGEPSAAMLFGLVFFAEIPTWISLLGMVITIAALTFLCLSDKGESIEE